MQTTRCRKDSHNKHDISAGSASDRWWSLCHMAGWHFCETAGMHTALALCEPKQFGPRCILWCCHWYAKKHTGKLSLHRKYLVLSSDNTQAFLRTVPARAKNLLYPLQYWVKAAPLPAACSCHPHGAHILWATRRHVLRVAPSKQARRVPSSAPRVMCMC